VGPAAVPRRVVGQRLFHFHPPAPLNVVSAKCHQAFLNLLTRAQPASISSAPLVSAFDELAALCVRGTRAFIGQERLTAGSNMSVFAAFPNLCRASQIAAERMANRFDRALILHVKLRRVWGIRAALSSASSADRARSCEWAQLSRQMAAIEAERARYTELLPLERIDHSLGSSIGRSAGSRVGLPTVHEAVQYSDHHQAQSATSPLPALKLSTQLLSLAPTPTPKTTGSDRADSDGSHSVGAFPAIRVWQAPIVESADAATGSVIMRNEHRTRRPSFVQALSPTVLVANRRQKEAGAAGTRLKLPVLERHRRSQSDCGGNM
jgi:hypothetical protein